MILISIFPNIRKGVLLLIGNGSPSFRCSFAEGAQAAASIGFSLVISVLLA